MTVAAKPATASYVEDGVSISFPVPFRFKAAGDLLVDRVLDVGGVAVLALGTDYSVTGGQTDAGGTVTRTAATTGATLRIRRRTARQQRMVYATGDRFPAKSHEEAIDTGVLIAQEQDDDIADTAERALLAPDGERGFELPSAAARRGRTLVVGSASDGALGMLDSTLFKGDPGGNVLAVGPAEALPLIAVDAGVNVVIVDGYGASADGGTGTWQVEPGAAPIGFVETRAAKRTKNNRVARLPKNEPIRLSRFGARVGSSADQNLILNDIAEIAANEGYTLAGDPYTTYRKDGQILLTSSFDGQGCTFQAMSNGMQAFNVYPIFGRVITPGLYLKNFTTLGAASERTSSPGDCGLTVGQAGVPSISDIVLENIRVGSVDNDPARGHAAAGIAIANASRVWIPRPIVKNCKADGITFIHGAQDGYVLHPIVENAGDDSFSVVSYRWYGALCNNITFDRATSINGGSRGGSVVGGRNVRFPNLTVRGSAGAAFYAASEASFDTFGVDNVQALGLTAEGCVVGGGAASGDPNFSNAIVLMAGRDGEDVINNEVFARSVRDVTVTGIIRGAGARAAQGSENNNPFVIRPRVDLDIQGIPLNIPGALIGGVDGEHRINGRDLGGVPIVIGAGAVGRHYVYGSRFDRGRTANPAANTCILLNAAPDITELRIERVEFNATSDRLYNTDAGFDLTKLRQRNNRIDGRDITGTDFSRGQVAFMNNWVAGPGFSITKRADGYVRISGSVTGGTVGGGVQVFTIPAGFRPVADLKFTGVSGGQAQAVLTAYASGEVGMDAGINGLDIWFNLEFLAA